MRWEPACFIGKFGKLASAIPTECEEEVGSGSGRGWITQGLWALVLRAVIAVGQFYEAE